MTALPGFGAAGCPSAGVCILHQSMQGKIPLDAVAALGFKLRMSNSCAPDMMVTVQGKTHALLLPSDPLLIMQDSQKMQQLVHRITNIVQSFKSVYILFPSSFCCCEEVLDVCCRFRSQAGFAFLAPGDDPVSSALKLVTAVADAGVGAGAGAGAGAASASSGPHLDILDQWLSEVGTFEAYQAALAAIPAAQLTAANVADLSSLGSLQALSCSAAEEMMESAGLSEHQTAGLLRFWTSPMT